MNIISNIPSGVDEFSFKFETINRQEYETWYVKVDTVVMVTKFCQYFQVKKTRLCGPSGVFTLQQCHHYFQYCQWCSARWLLRCKLIFLFQFKVKPHSCDFHVHHQFIGVQKDGNVFFIKLYVRGLIILSSKNFLIKCPTNIPTSITVSNTHWKIFFAYSWTHWRKYQICATVLFSFIIATCNPLIYFVH